MRPQPSVVAEGQREPALEIGPEQGWSRSEDGDALQGAEETLDEGNGPGLPDGAVAVAYGETAECLLDLLRGELRSSVGDGVSRRAEAADCAEEEAGDVAAAWLGEEHLGREGHPREDVEDEGEFEGEEPQESGDLGEVHHPDVVREAGTHATACRKNPLLNWRRGDRLLLADPLDGPAGQPETCAGEVRASVWNWAAPITATLSRITV